MNSKLIILALSLMAQTAFSNIAHSADTLPGAPDSANVNITNRYALPPSKVNIEPCQREALRLHPGVIEKQRILHRHGNFLVRFQVQADDGFDWFMLCDLATRKIIDAF
ncbi:MAG: hypothetical protein EPN17_13755 [Methylobacter sp.]|nr:MAG: hypothetical protein EPN17_13755 [Methylobacter sp.]